MEIGLVIAACPSIPEDGLAIGHRPPSFVNFDLSFPATEFGMTGIRKRLVY